MTAEDARCTVCGTRVERSDPNDPESYVHAEDGDWGDHTAEHSSVPSLNPDDLLPASFAEEVEVLRSSFEFELCEVCHGDLEDHVIAPDPLGHAHLYCLAEPDQDDLTWAREDMGPTFTEDEVYEVASRRARERARERRNQ